MPALSFWFSFQTLHSEASGLLVAVATSLASIVFIASRAAFKHFQTGNVDFDISNRMIWGAFAGSLIAAWLAPNLPSFALKLIVGLFLFLVSLIMFFHWQPNPARHFPNVIGGNFIGSLCGSVASLVGIAGGNVLVPTMLFFNIPHTELQLRPVYSEYPSRWPARFPTCSTHPILKLNGCLDG